MPTLDSSEYCARAFADRHIHGIAGVDFATSPVADIEAGLRLLGSRGTTSVTASIPTVECTEVSEILRRLEPLVYDGRLAGVHFEGPFIAADYAGAHPKDAVLSPASSQGKAFLDLVLEHQSAHPMVTMMTAAPELEGFDDLVRRLIDHRITPALGHTAATAEQMRTGIDTVYALTDKPVVITHLYNAMRGFHHRDPGPLLSILEAAEHDKVVVELIADGHHVDLTLIAWWFANYPDAVRLVSDASAATLPAGTVPIGSDTPRLGQSQLAYPSTGGPLLADRLTLASGGTDLLGVHDALVAAGLAHQVVCTAMQADGTDS